MLQRLGRPNFVLNDHDVEPASAISDTMLGKILRGQLNQFGAFASIDRFNGTPEGARAPPLDLDKHQHALIIGDQVELA
jgi:hypothetical protein